MVSLQKSRQQDLGWKKAPDRSHLKIAGADCLFLLYGNVPKKMTFFYFSFKLETVFILLLLNFGEVYSIEEK